MNRIYLVRHGLAAPSGILIGQRNDGLTEEGRSQAKALGLHLAKVPFCLAFSSPLQRACETGHIILAGRTPLQPVQDLREISLGLWEGRSKAWIREHYPQEWNARGQDFANVAPPEGESVAQLALRVLPAFEQICMAVCFSGGNALVVAHQAVNRVILAHRNGIRLQHIGSIPQPPCAMTILGVAK